HQVHVVHGLDISRWSYFEVFNIVKDLKYNASSNMKMWSKMMNENFENLREFKDDIDVMGMSNFVRKLKSLVVHLNDEEKLKIKSEAIMVLEKAPINSTWMKAQTMYKSIQTATNN
ncbi:unnamed protein product, partial [Sphenostylis stenocarpa]